MDNETKKIMANLRTQLEILIKETRKIRQIHQCMHSKDGTHLLDVANAKWCWSRDLQD